MIIKKIKFLIILIILPNYLFAKSEYFQDGIELFNQSCYPSSELDLSPYPA